WHHVQKTARQRQRGSQRGEGNQADDGAAVDDQAPGTGIASWQALGRVQAGGIRGGARLSRRSDWPEGPGCGGRNQLLRRPAQATSRTGVNPPKIMRLPSKGIAPSSFMRGSDIIFFCPSSRTAFEGHSIQEKTTISSGSVFTEP